MKHQPNPVLALVVCVSLVLFPLAGEAKPPRVPPPYPAFNVILPTVGGHPSQENRAGAMHGETHHVQPHEFDDLFDRLHKALPAVPPGEAIELSFHFSPLWTPEARERFRASMQAKFQKRFPHTPLKLELHHPHVPRRLYGQMPQPGTDEMLLMLKRLEETAPSAGDRAAIHEVVDELEQTQPVVIETDNADEVENFPRRLEQPERTRLLVTIFSTLQTLLKAGIFYHVLKHPGLDTASKNLWAWSIILSHMAINFTTSAYQQPFGEFLAKHEFPKLPLMKKSFWTRINDWYCGRKSAKAAERAELIKQGAYNYLFFTLLLTPLTQWAATHTDGAAPMNWPYFIWTATLSAVATVVFVWGAKGLRTLRQLGTKTGASIDKKYGTLSLLSPVTDVGNVIPALGKVRYLTLGITMLVQWLDARRAAREKPRVNRYVFIDSWLPDEVRSRSIKPVENVDDTRLYGRDPAGHSENGDDEIENFVSWVLQLPRLPGVQSVSECAEQLKDAAA